MPAFEAIERLGYRVDGENADEAWTRVSEFSDLKEIVVKIAPSKARTRKAPPAYDCLITLKAAGKTETFTVVTAMPALLVGALDELGESTDASFTLQADAVHGRNAVVEARTKNRREYRPSANFKSGASFYSFDSWGDIGALVLSAKGIALQEELDKRRTLMAHDEQGQQDLESWLQSVLDHHPDFAPGTVELAHLRMPARREGLGQILDEQLARVEANIPTDFDKRLPGEMGDNLTYQELLMSRFELYGAEGRIDDAVATLSRLNRHSGLPSFFTLNASQFLVSHGRYKEAAKLSEREPLYMALGPLMQGFASFGAGDMVGFRRCILEALFRWPNLREFVTGPLSSEFTGHEGGSQLNSQFVERLYRPILKSIPGLTDAVLGLVEEDGVFDAEKFLEDVRRSQDRKMFGNDLEVGNTPPWSRTVSEYAAGLAVSPAFVWTFPGTVGK